ncbi:MAG: hypothetical protein GF401_07685 [Chitinivibrionales bacterium]|nr:hypothetical protein [Chitinivibrionales bacterium]
MALEKVISDDKFRRDIARKGFQRSLQFNWERSAKQLLSVFEDILNNS